MRILITNDDGIHAPGLKSCEKIARELTDDIWVVAPETDQSGSSHSLTINDPLRLREISERHFAVKGTPTDCVIMAIKHIMPEPPDLVLSGVNRGHNVAEDVTYSGTIAGAFEGSTLGVRSIALSQAVIQGEHRRVPWETAEAHGAGVVRRLLESQLDTTVILNVNFPPCEPGEVTGTDVTTQGRRDQAMLGIDARVDGRGNPYYWLAFERRRFSPGKGTDLRAMDDRRISVTPLGLNLTDASAHAILLDHLGEREVG